MKINSANEIYLIGSFSGTIDADPGSGTTTLSPINSTYAMLVEKLDSAGNFIWAKPIDGGGGNVLYLDNNSNIYFTGGYNATIDVDPGAGVHNLVFAGGNGDILIEMLDSAGNFQWAKGIGSGSADGAGGITVDTFGNVLVTGHFGGTVDFDPGAGTHLLTSNSTRSIFTLKLRNNGDFAWAQKAGYGAGLYEGRGIATDTAGQVYVVSNTYPLQKFDSTGQLLWELETAGTAGWICLDNENSIYLSG